MSAFSVDPALVTPGVLGFLVVASIGFALYLLIKSMNKRISKIELPHEADVAREERRAKQAAAGAGDRNRSGKSGKKE